MIEAISKYWLQTQAFLGSPIISYQIRVANSKVQGKSKSLQKCNNHCNLLFYIKLSFSDRIWVWCPQGSPTWQHRVEDEVLSGRTTSWILHEDPTWKRQLRISTPCVAMNLIDFDSLHRCSQCAPDYLTLISTAAIDIHCLVTLKYNYAGVLLFKTSFGTNNSNGYVNSHLHIYTFTRFTDMYRLCFDLSRHARTCLEHLCSLLWSLKIPRQTCLKYDGCVWTCLDN